MAASVMLVVASMLAYLFNFGAVWSAEAQRNNLRGGNWLIGANQDDTSVCMRKALLRLSADNDSRIGLLSSLP